MRVAGKVAAVTGAGSGIGRALAIHLAEQGAAAIALADIDAAGLSETAALVSGTTSTHVVDVRDADAVQRFADEVVAHHGRCELVVNNAGVATAGRFEDDDLELVHWVMDINVWGVIHGCRSFLPVLRQQPEGHLVNVSSMAAFVGMPGNAAYSASKGAVRLFTESLRSELIRTPIGVTSVHPGTIRTNIMASSRGSQADLIARLAAKPWAGRFMTSPEAVARAVVRGVERNRARVVVGPDARVLDLVARAVPGRSGLIGRLTARVGR